ncbi:hypothetical protein SBA5_450003 [Candidatus Sulfotelmatomonas gaucii]|uniref:Uncharacterized protein n=1 Tax=Candidatus Sulfuritelmatomonas gaucii TaxID=2043161 RepID=A0A2N9LM63_9BACT|nr:hypothetical protein SBA5_450003 [Candidatus Sulfotelmatomonas gaucii]
MDGTIQRGANVGLGGWQASQRDFERGAGGEFINVSQKLFNDLLMFSSAALGNLVLANFLNFKSRGVCRVVAHHRLCSSVLMRCTRV